MSLIRSVAQYCYNRNYFYRLSQKGWLHLANTGSDGVIMCHSRGSLQDGFLPSVSPNTVASALREGITHILKCQCRQGLPPDKVADGFSRWWVVWSRGEAGVYGPL